MNSMLIVLLIIPLLIGLLQPLIASDSKRLRSIAAVAPSIQLCLGIWFLKNPPDSISIEWLPQLGLKLELGETDGEGCDVGLGELLGLTDREELAEGETEALGLTEALGETEAEGEELKSPV